MTGKEAQDIIKIFLPEGAKPSAFHKLSINGILVTESEFIFPKKGNLALFRQMRQLAKVDEDIEVRGRRSPIHGNIFRVYLTIHSPNWVITE
jgi:hypothetical protein